jgi:hypothetical protein
MVFVQQRKARADYLDRLEQFAEAQPRISIPIMEDVQHLVTIRWTIEP